MFIGLQMHIINKRLVPLEHRYLGGLAVIGVTSAWPTHHSTFHVFLQGGASGGVCEFCFALFQRTDGCFVPSRKLIKQAHRFERKLKLNWQTDINRQDHRFAIRFFSPGELPAPVGWVGRIIHDSIPVERAATCLGKFDQEVELQALQCFAHRPLDRTTVIAAQHLGHFQIFFARCNLGWQIATIIVSVSHAKRCREAKAAGFQSLAQQVLHLGDFFRFGLILGITGSFVAHHPCPQWRIGNKRGRVHPKPVCIQAVQKLRKGDPIPTHPSLHNRQWDSFRPLHTQHRSFTIFWTNRRKAKAAVADSHSGHAMPTRQCRIRVPAAQRSIVVGVNIHEARRND